MKFTLQCYGSIKDSVALVRERPLLVDEVSANFCGYRVSCGQRTHEAEWTPKELTLRLKIVIC
jgi:hypothetical protein